MSQTQTCKFKIPAELATKSPAEIAELIRLGKADIAPFRDDQGRIVIVLADQE